MISCLSSSAGSLSSSGILRMSEKLLKKIDTNEDGSISKEEFVSNRPKDMSETQADDMWSTLDTGNTGNLTGSEFLATLQSQKPPQGPPPGGFGSMEGSSGSNGQSLSDLFSKIDMDGDGSVSKEEFISNRPDDVSEEQATNMWESLDTESTGSLDQEQFVTAMQNQKPPQGPPPEDFGSTTSDVSTSIDSSDITDDMLQALLSAISKYSLVMNGTGSSTQDTSGISTLLSSIG